MTHVISVFMLELGVVENEVELTREAEFHVNPAKHEKLCPELRQAGGGGEGI